MFAISKICCFFSFLLLLTWLSPYSHSLSRYWHSFDPNGIWTCWRNYIWFGIWHFVWVLLYPLVLNFCTIFFLLIFGFTSYLLILGWIGSYFCVNFDRANMVKSMIELLINFLLQIAPYEVVHCFAASKSSILQLTNSVLSCSLVMSAKLNSTFFHWKIIIHIKTVFHLRQ